DRGYKLESEDGKTFTFRKKWFVNRLGKFLEDRITITVVSDIEATEAPEDQTTTTTTNPENQNTYTESQTSENQTSTEVNDTQENTQITQAEETADNNGTIYSGSLNKYTVNLEGLTKDVVRIVSALYRVQNQSTAE
ncbi:MAG: hypothetical protein LUC24_00585, partial [Bacteroidales bacterium]|nr:hypothetical protein [Bacteroidales bacterium]